MLNKLIIIFILGYSIASAEGIPKNEGGYDRGQSDIYSHPAFQWSYKHYPNDVPNKSYQPHYDQRYSGELNYQSHQYEHQNRYEYVPNSFHSSYPKLPEYRMHPDNIQLFQQDRQYLDNFHNRYDLNNYNGNKGYKP